MKNKTICFVAGKSGGHIIPCLTIAQQYKTDNPHTKILFFSSNTPLDNRILAHNDLVDWHKTVPLSHLARGKFIPYAATALKALYSFFISFFYLCKNRPSAVISTGGIVAIPTCIAAFILRIPITVYALDALPGKAIKALIPCASVIHVCFKTAQKQFPQKKCSYIPYPVKYTDKKNMPDKQTAQKNVGLSLDKKTILILGGSQGSVFLNDCIKNIISKPGFNNQTTQIIHQTGSTDSTDWKSLYNSRDITAHVFSYHPELSLLYIAADVIICRAGAGTLFEIKFFEKKCIIIPLKTNTTDHQIHNAHAMSADYPDLFEYILQEDVEKNPTVLSSRLNQIFGETLSKPKQESHQICP